jgi:dihydroneopterin triphosphate diphosphatase
VTHKIPVSTLVVIHSPDLQVLLLERADRPGFWQSVTGSQHEGEALRDTAIREVGEETGLDAASDSLAAGNLQNVFEIYPVWRHRFAPGVTHNTEHVFGLEVPSALPVRVAPKEHLAAEWVPWKEAAERVFSWSNRKAILMLPARKSG